MKEKKLFFLIFGIILCILVILLFSNSLISIFQKDSLEHEKIVHVQKLPVELEVVESNIIGLNVDKNNSYLKFGQVGRGTTSIKKIIILNLFNESVNVSMGVDENMSRFIYANESNFILNKGGNRSISISAYVDKSEESGIYSGFLIVVMRESSYF